MKSIGKPNRNIFSPRKVAPTSPITPEKIDAFYQKKEVAHFFNKEKLIVFYHGTPMTPKQIFSSVVHSNYTESCSFNLFGSRKIGLEELLNNIDKLCFKNLDEFTQKALILSYSELKKTYEELREVNFPPPDKFDISPKDECIINPLTAMNCKEKLEFFLPVFKQFINIISAQKENSKKDFLFERSFKNEAEFITYMTNHPNSNEFKILQSFFMKCRKPFKEFTNIKFEEALWKRNTKWLKKSVFNGADNLNVGAPQRTALHIAITKHPPDRELIELLLEKGANPNIQNEHGNTPIHEAATTKSYDIYETLLIFGANPRIENNLNKTAEDILFEK